MVSCVADQLRGDGSRLTEGSDMALDRDGRSSGHEIAQGTFKRKKLDFIARRVILKVRAPEGDESLASVQDSIMASAENCQVLRSPGKSGRMVVLLPEGESVPNWAKRLDGLDHVAYAEPDIVDHAQIVPNDPRYPDQWAPPMVRAEDAWDLETGNTNVVIGVIDSGISMSGGILDHDDLDDASRIILGTDYVDGGTPRDLNGHGTHVAGIAGAAGNNAAGIAGMNWGSPLYICRTLDANGNGSSADFADAVEEITDYAVANGLKAVINYSGGGGANQTKQDACQYASDNGMLVVAAAGNDNGGPVIWPAAYSASITGVVAVGSTDSADNVSGFSNVGPEINVVAPGSNILSTTPTYSVRPTLDLNYDTMSGTSMATPLVSGLAALMWSRHPSFTNQKVRTCLEDTAVPLGTGTFNNSWGHGRVDAYEAVKCGDPIVVAPTKIGPACGVIKTHLVTCVPKSVICPTSFVRGCPSKLPRLCPTTALTGCWSKLACFDVKTQLASCDIKTMVCPSAVDACPSAPGGCDWDPGPILRRLTNLERRFGLMDAERWYGDEGAGGGTGETEGWFYVDDDGNVHEA